MAEVRGGYDVVFDNINTALRDYATAQAVIDSEYDFGVVPDSSRIEPGQAAAVYTYLGNITPDASSSSVLTSYAYDVEYIIECVVKARGEKTVSDYTRADEAAGVRLRYLIQQVIDALYPLARADFGMSVGTITKKQFVRVQQMSPDAQRQEQAFKAAQLTLSISMQWEPAELTGPDLDQISVDAGRWSVLYDYGA